jgi:hypothetical protein
MVGRWHESKKYWPLFRKFLGVYLQGPMKNLSQNSVSPGRGSNRVPDEFEGVMFILRDVRSHHLHYYTENAGWNQYTGAMVICIPFQCHWAIRNSPCTSDWTDNSIVGHFYDIRWITPNELQRWSRMACRYYHNTHLERLRTTMKRLSG